MILKIPKRLLFLFVLVFAVLSISTTYAVLLNPTITVVSPVTGTIYSYYPTINISTDINSTVCKYVINGSTASAINLNPGSTNNKTWANSSILTTGNYSDTPYGSWTNMTFLCFNYTTSNSSWYNTTNTSGFVLFRIDTVDPSVSFQTGANGINFTTQSTGIWNWTFNYTDNSYATCGLRYYQYPSTSTYAFISGATSNPSLGLLSKANCTLLFDPNDTALSNVRNEGEFTLEGFGNDTASRSAVTSTNFTGVMTKIYGSKWNLITYRGANRTASSSQNVTEFILNNFEYATIISVWNQTYGNFTTYSASTPTVNSQIILSLGTAFYMYSNADKWFIQPDYTPTIGTSAENITLYANHTNRGNSWNQMGLFNNATMNTTLYTCSLNATNATYFWSIYRAATCPVTLNNITYISWLNASSGQLVTCKRGVSICSGGSNPKDIVLKEGYAIWVMPDKNITINRSSIY
jgi:hypothetical protein